jgi:hypothetical protein
MSATTILTSALQDDSDAGTAVDVTAFSTLRLDWSVVADLGRVKQIDLFIETGPTDAGPWHTISERRMLPSHITGPYAWEANPRATLGGFDAFVRARWEGFVSRVHGEESTNFFTIGLSGDGQPDAA